MVTTVRDPRVVVPRLPPKYVSRARLLDDLDQAASLPLTLLCAGPGAGKTALLADWAGSRPGTARVAWVVPGGGGLRAGPVLAADRVRAARRQPWRCRRRWRT